MKVDGVLAMKGNGKSPVRNFHAEIMQEAGDPQRCLDPVTESQLG
jgi:hypothetical protein